MQRVLWVWISLVLIGVQIELSVATSGASEPTRDVAEGAANNSYPDLAEAAERLQRHVETLPVDERTRWRRGVNWPILRQVAAGAAPLDEAMMLAKQFYGLQQGLEDPAFTNVRQLLDRWISQQVVLSAAPAESERRRRLLREALVQQPCDVQAIQEHASWLEAAGLLDRDTLLAARRAAPQPTVILHFDRDLFAQQLNGFQESMERSRQAGNCIAGAWVTGPASVQGAVTADLPANASEARVVLRIQGSVRTPANVAHKGKVRVFSSGETRFSGEKILYWSNGRVTAEPATIHAQTDAQLRGVAVPFLRKPALLHRLVENYALKKAENLRPQGELESALLAEQQLGEELDQEVAVKLEEANGKVNEFFHMPLTRLGLSTRITSAAGDSHLAVGVLAYDGGIVLGAPTVPASRPVKGKIQVMVHESMIGKLTRPSVGGAWLTDRDFADFQKELVGEYAHHFRLGPHFRRWSVQLDWRRPLITRIHPSMVRFEVRRPESAHR